MPDLHPEQFRLFRSENRPDGEDLSKPDSIGVHWTTRPIDYGWGEEPGKRNRVVWHANVGQEHVADTTDKFGEGEVVLKNGAEIRVHGRSVTRGPRGYVDPTETPEIPMDLKVPIKGRQIK